ncbi:hypothetical protein EXIGLDRAFT_783437 [Exidia glandulosa HHB12029]|uniref:Cyanovirin-N domain-containing protein n=1 Tax=Exidia glandulosa HHB12029 TaxID=1314781 RepID=A0A166N254_EXIGL|nr:hypothetical protein EXIGLDRAFT_783437 [Exidia glandulosa HHB12029]
MLNATHVDGDHLVCTPFPLDLVLGNIDGKFKWGNRGFSASASDVELSGTTLVAQLKDASGMLVKDSIDLNECFTADEERGALKAVDVPVILYMKNANIAVPKGSELPEGVVFDSVISSSKNASVLPSISLASPPEFSVKVATGEGDDAKVGYATAQAEHSKTSVIDGVVGTTADEASASAEEIPAERPIGREEEEV